MGQQCLSLPIASLACAGRFPVLCANKLKSPPKASDRRRVAARLTESVEPIAILRVQPAKDLVESLMRPVTDNDEFVWEGILEEMERDMMRHQRRMPSTTGADSAYRLEDIRS